MPIYEFVCEICGCRFEALTRLGGEKTVACPSCGGSKVKKQASSFGIGGGGSRLKKSSASCGTCASKSCGTCR